MNRPLCSVVLATYQRAHLLVRSLTCYQFQEFPASEFELVVIDDSSNDNTSDLVREWSDATGIRTIYLKPYPKLEAWRDCGAVLNYGIRASSGKHILLSHPEIMVGRTSVLDCVKELERFESGRIEQGKIEERTPIGLYSCCRCYYLSPRDQVLLDSVDWINNGPIAVRNIDQFYEADTNGNPDYSHRATDFIGTKGYRIQTWDSWVFGGHSRQTWKRLGGMLETNKWGAVDVAWRARRQTLGIPNYTCPSESAICAHQNHDLVGDVVTPRDMDAWVRELRDTNFQMAGKLIYPIVDNLGWS